MKVEPRGKYPGVKVHLEADDAQLVIDIAEGDTSEGSELYRAAWKLLYRMAKKVKRLSEDEPGLLTERTPAQIAAALEKEVASATAKKATLAAGQDWTKVKVKVEVEE